MSDVVCVCHQADRLVQLGVALKGPDIRTDVLGTNNTINEDGVTDAKLTVAAEQLGNSLKVGLHLNAAVWSWYLQSSLRGTLWCWLVSRSIMQIRISLRVMHIHHGESCIYDIMAHHAYICIIHMYVIAYKIYKIDYTYTHISHCVARYAVG